MKSFQQSIITGVHFVWMSQQLVTEICQCKKLKQLGKVCKSCGFTAEMPPAEFAAPVIGVRAQARIRRAVEVMVEDELERARR